MTRQLLIWLMPTLGLSCMQNGQASKTEINVSDSVTAKTKVTENIHFDFSAGRINTFKETIEINATICNDNTDTICFLSSSCDGEQYSLRYDTAKFVLTPFLICNASYPRLVKIAPKGQHDFQAHFRCSKSTTKIKLGFDFYSIDKSFDLPNNNFGDINIFNRPEYKQTIIWANEKTIK